MSHHSHRHRRRHRAAAKEKKNSPKPSKVEEANSPPRFLAGPPPRPAWSYMALDESGSFAYDALRHPNGMCEYGRYQTPWPTSGIVPMLTRSQARFWPTESCGQRSTATAPRHIPRIPAAGRGQPGLTRPGISQGRRAAKPIVMKDKTGSSGVWQCVCREKRYRNKTPFGLAKTNHEAASWLGK